MRKRILLFLIVLVLRVGYGFNLRVAPTGFSEKLERPVARLVYVYNETKQPMRVMVGIENDERSPEEYGLKDNIKVFPKVLTIPPKGKRTVRFRIDSTGLEDGEYKSFLFFKEMSREKTREDIVKEVDDGEIGVSINMLTNLGIAVYGYVGEIVPGVEIVEDTISKQNGNWVLDVIGKTTGNCSMAVTANVKYLDKSGTELGRESVSNKVVRGSSGRMRMTLVNTPPETYRLEVEYVNKQDDTLKKASYNFEL